MLGIGTVGATGGQRGLGSVVVDVALDIDVAVHEVVLLVGGCGTGGEVAIGPVKVDNLTAAIRGLDGGEEVVALFAVAHLGLLIFVFGLGGLGEGRVAVDEVGRDGLWSNGRRIHGGGEGAGGYISRRANGSETVWTNLLVAIKVGREGRSAGCNRPWACLGAKKRSCWVTGWSNFSLEVGWNGGAKMTTLRHKFPERRPQTLESSGKALAPAKRASIHARHPQPWLACTERWYLLTYVCDLLVFVVVHPPCPTSASHRGAWSPAHHPRGAYILPCPA